MFCTFPTWNNIWPKTSFCYVPWQIWVFWRMAGDFCFYLLHAGYKFSVRTRYNQRTDWRCVDRQSLATLTTTDNIIMICGQSHNHDADFVWLAEGSLISGVRKSCGEEATPIPSIYDEELGGLSNTDYDETIVDMIRQVLTFQACRSSLYRSRAKPTQKLLSSQEKINIDGPWLGKDFYSAMILIHMETASSCSQHT